MTCNLKIMYKFTKLRVNTVFFSSGELCNIGKTTVQVGLLVPGALHSGSATSRCTGHSKPCWLPLEVCEHSTVQC